MSTPTATRHATVRMAQRGMRIGDAELIQLIGTEVADGYLVLAKDCQRIEREVKQFLARIWRLEGKRLVVVEGRILTGYHASKQHERRLLKGTQERDLA